MRSLYRMRRLALANQLGVRPFVPPASRCLSTSASRAAAQKANDAVVDQAALRRLDKELDRKETPASRPKWSDDAFRSGDAAPEASSSTSGFFTASRPFSPAVTPPSASEAQALQELMPLLQMHRDRRDEALCTRIWRLYHQMSPSTRRSLHPTILRMVLRAVVPSQAEQVRFKRRVQDPVRAFASQASRLERRLQVIVADMIRSSWVNKDDKQVTPAPSAGDYHYAMSALSHLGATEACEAIYRELSAMEGTASKRASSQVYRLRALKIWMTERIEFSTFTIKRPATAQAAPIPRSLRWRSDRQENDPSTFATRVLWDVLREVGRYRPDSRGALYEELMITLRRILEFLPETEVVVASTLHGILQQVLEKGYGIDFRFLRQDPAFAAASIRPPVLDTVMFLMGSQGDVWRMAAMYETLTSKEALSSAGAAEEAGAVDGDIGETLSDALAHEATARDQLDWLGRSKEVSVEAGPSSAAASDLPTLLRESSIPQSDGVRRYDDYISPISSPSSVVQDSTSGSSGEHPAPIDLDAYLYPVRTQTVTTMLNMVRQHGDVDLALHLLRTSLRDASSSRNAWLHSLTKHNPDSPEPANDWITRRTLLVSATWFEIVHHLVRTNQGARWAAGVLREIMEVETQAIREEYHVLTGVELEDGGEIPPTALIHRIAPASTESSPTGEKVFDPARHLSQLTQTHNEVVNLLSVSVRQVEKRRQLVAAKNARRAERMALAVKEEAERMEAKKAGRRKREEVVQSTLALA